MKTKIATILLGLTLGLGYAQNKSNGAITNTITPSLLPPGNTEAFRFRSGLVTQLDAGTAFDFTTNSQWASFGRLTTPNQTLFGYRAQRAGRGLVFGFTGAPQTTTPTLGTPVIEWVGNGTVTAGDLLFRTSPSSTSTLSTQVMRMKADGNSLFSTGGSLFEQGYYVIGSLNPNPYTSSENLHFTPKVEIATGGDGIAVISNGVSDDMVASLHYSNNFSTSGLSTASYNFASGKAYVVGTNSIAIGSDDAYLSYGTRSQSYGSKTNCGVYGEGNGGETTYGVYAVANPTTSQLSNSYGTYSIVNGSNTTNSINYGVYAKATGFNAIAGYFDGKIFATSSLIASDKSLKKDILSEKSCMEKINKLKPVTYNMIQNAANLKISVPSKMQHGFVAQDLELVYPEFVEEVLHPVFNEKNEQTGTKTLKSVNYIGLISVLTQAMQEMSTEMTILKEKVKTLEGKNGNVTARMSANAATNSGYVLSQNTPNPFNSATTIEYAVPADQTNAAILIFNFTGETIKEFKLSDAKGSITIQAAGMPKGIYFYALVVNGQEIITKKMIVN
jgi:Chaperone of endosialidase/Secretion system C-terminal sorting domain